MDDKWKKFGLDGPRKYVIEAIDGTLYYRTNAESIEWRDENGAAQFKLISDTDQEIIFTAILSTKQIATLLFAPVTNLTIEGRAVHGSLWGEDIERRQGRLNILNGPVTKDPYGWYPN